MIPVKPHKPPPLSLTLESNMNSWLQAYIGESIEDASRFVTNFMPVDISSDDAYEAMLACNNAFNHTDMIKALHDAVAYLPPSHNFRRMAFDIEGHTAQASLRINLESTVKWPMFLIPTGTWHIGKHSKLFSLLQLPLDVARQWAMLRWVWSTAMAQDFSVQVLAYLMPWMRDLVATYNQSNVPEKTLKAERRIIERECATIMRADVPPCFPSGSKSLMAVMRSGRELFAQYNLLSHAHAQHGLGNAVLCVEPTIALVPNWVPTEWAEFMNDWQDVKQRRQTRLMDQTVERANAKFDKWQRLKT